MSQWNNAYAYDNQFMESNASNVDLNGRYLNQSYTDQPYNQQFDSSNQYVNFNQFLTQIQSGNVAGANATIINDCQNMPSTQFNYQQDVPQTLQTAQPDSYNHAASGSNTATDSQTYQIDNQNSAPDKSYTSEVVLKSNLTPTAMEFVPKMSNVRYSNSQLNVRNESSKSSGVKESKSNQGSSSDRNWRERPKISNNGSRFNNDSHRDYNNHSHKNKDSHHNEGSSSSRDHEPSYSNDRNYEPNHRDFEYNGRNFETNNRNYDPNSKKYENNSRNYDSTSENYDSGSRNHDSNNKNYSSNRNYDSNGRNYDANNRNYDSSNRNYESKRRNYDSNGRNYDSSGRNYDSNARNYDSNSGNYDSNVRNDNRNGEGHSRTDQRGQSKNSKTKNKDPALTFYNSTISKQDARNGKEVSGRGKSFVGSQRVRPVDRDMTEDEQFAKSYLQHRDERAERSSYHHQHREERNERFRDREREHVPSPARSRKIEPEGNNNTDMTQRERLSEQLDKGTLECLVCCERVKQVDSVWSCTNCYHVLHLRCIRKWALSSVVEGKWRCPACQNESLEVPMEYRCLCGAVRSPEHARGAAGAHTCGRACKRARACAHPCPLLCHPGPCPPCLATVTKQCGCGAESRSVVCSNKTPQVCAGQCKRVLPCGVHTCARDCHEGACGDCDQTITQVCYCNAANARTVACTAETGGKTAWACGGACSRVRACGVHACSEPCHPPPCAPCPLLPERVHTCPCGKTKLEAGKRTKCTDPIPVCGAICAKPLECGPPDDKHFCKVDCHQGDCPPCPDSTVVPCRCGHSTRDVPCVDLPSVRDNVLCQKKCNKKLSCGRHRCRAQCCAATTHRCGVVCGRMRTCQLHRCDEFCHTGHCAPCPTLSFEELRCACGAEVVLPPVRCGARPPACSAPCRRQRECGHAPHHCCHAGPCPPCVVLTTKMCHGRHEERKTIPCSQEEFSCGLPCGKPLPCGKHTCIKTCHKGPCDTGKCSQPCTEKRPMCGHECAAPCHAGPCPAGAPCRRAVRATCQCGRRATERACADNARDLAKIMSAQAAAKMQEGGSVDLSDMQRPTNMLKTLECDDECRVEARTRQMALALQIRNPDVSSKLAPRYSDHIRALAAKEPAFAQHVHDKLTELVQLAKKSKQRTRAHSFPSMNWQKRQFIHELCEQFGCESVAYDAEPNRNVVATADREKSWLPAMSILEVLSREAGKRRVPGPVLRASTSATGAGTPASSAGKSSSGSGWATLTSTNAWAARSQQRAAAAPPATPTDKIDYFDNPPE